ncbi:GAF domain-containing protein [Streptomyces sp. CRN 30]|uniref:GAF domain-containing protein n=1 Tax=Streptomyces sp. CRN 30 TaxID=3075613 RepID=UPI002A7FEA31|nr:GAF domain-containing protein [Streptomyces sp. CRN 30]
MHKDDHSTLWRRLAETGDVSLRSACAVCAADLSSDGLGVILITDGELRTIGHATDPRARHLENAQLVSGEGPCTEAYVTDRLVEAPDLRAVRERWPVFTRAADEQGLRAVTALPLATGRLRVGAMDLYRAAPGPLTDGERTRVRGWARIVAMLALDAHPGMVTDEYRRVRPGPQGYPPRVHAAAGVLAEADGLTPFDALARMRAHAFSHDRSLLETADRVISERSLDGD